MALSVLSFFCLMSRIDFIVHRTLYHYGLKFSYEWANEYWITYTATFILFSVVMGLMYWLSSNKTAKDLKISFGLIVTINLLMIGGLQDVMFYVLWAGGLPPNNVTWWWVPWARLFGIWNSLTQVILTVFASSITAFLWINIFRK